MAVGIICEYNPFHNGHLYHLEKVKEMFKDEEIILVLGGNFTQRGEMSIIDKYDKTKIALEYGVNLVIELPYLFCCNSSDFFAKSVIFLEKLKCKYVIFGIENDNVDNLIICAKMQKTKEYNTLVKKYLDKGENYPTSLSLALKDLTNIEITKPNELLALSYVKEIINNNLNIKPIAIKRTNNYHSEKLESELASATSIRKALKENIDIDKYVPKETLKYINKNNYDDNFFKLLKYKIITDRDLSIYNTVDEGIDKRIKKNIDKCKNKEELINSIKTKRYTYGKINRMLLHILTSTTKDDIDTNIKYIKILGFDDKGRKYLNMIKKDIDVPLITNVNKKNYNLLKNDIKIDKLYYFLKGKNKNVFEDKPIVNIHKS